MRTREPLGRMQIRNAVALAGAAMMMGGALTAAPKLNVVATTPDLGSIAKEVGRDRIELTTLAKPTEDPHFVDAKPSFIVKLNRADALVEGGAELEAAWLAPLLEGARNPRIAAGQPGRVACANGVTMLEVPETLDRSKGDLHAAGNPHYTTDPLNGKIVAENIAEAFCRLEPEAAEFFRANLKDFTGRLEAKMAAWQKALEPFQGRRVVTYHNYWPYFAKRFGLRMDLFLEPKPGIPPSPAHLAALVAQMKTERIRVILVQPYVNRKTAERVAGLTGATVLDVAAFPGEGQTDGRRKLEAGGQDYLGWMEALVTGLAQAFRGK